MNRRLWLVGCATLSAALLLALIAEPSLAQTSDVGKNVGREIKSWASAILLGVAAMVAIPIFAKRDIGGGFVLAILVVLVGGFVFAQDSVKSVIDNLWGAVGR